jgi:hypothetical protein
MWLPWFLLALSSCALSSGPSEYTRLQGEPTVGTIRMEPDTSLRIVYDDRPGITFLTLPSDIGYDLLLEMAQSKLRPGRAARLRTAFETYDVTPEREFMIYGWASAPTVQSEPSEIFIGQDDRRYNCFRKFLSNTVGKHQMAFSQHEMAKRCYTSTELREVKDRGRDAYY